MSYLVILIHIEQSFSLRLVILNWLVIRRLIWLQKLLFSYQSKRRSVKLLDCIPFRLHSIHTQLLTITAATESEFGNSQRVACMRYKPIASVFRSIRLIHYASSTQLSRRPPSQDEIIIHRLRIEKTNPTREHSIQGRPPPLSARRVEFS